MTDAALPALSPRRSSVAIACVLAALALVVLDAAVVNVALPDLARSLRVPVADAVHVVTAYQLGLVMALLPCGALGESLGHRRVYTAGVALFVAASLLCALAPTRDALVAARFLQGLGGAAVMALGSALMRFTVRPQRLGAAIGWHTMTVALASAAGPTLGALTIALASWRGLFLVNLPLGVLVLIAARALPDVPRARRELDLVSVGLNALTFGLLVTGAERLATHVALGVLLLLGGAGAATALVRRERRVAAPLVPLDLLRDPSLRGSVIASVACFLGQSAAMISLPFHLQHAVGASTLRTGLFITPWPLAVALAAPVASRRLQRHSGATLGALGGGLLALGLALVARWPLARAPLANLAFIALCGAGFGLFQVSNNRNMLASAPRERSGAAGAMQSIARLTGQTLGAVMMTVLFAATSVEAAARLGIALAAGLTALAGLASLLRSQPLPLREAGAL